MSKLTIVEMQTQVDKWIKTIGVRYFNELTNMAILTEEVGEFSKIVARVYGEQSFKKITSEEEAKEKLEDEMADVLWVLTCLANQMDINLEDAFNKNMKKKTKRDINRHEQNHKLSL